MRGHPVEDIAEKPDEKHAAKAAYRVLYGRSARFVRLACHALVSASFFLTLWKKGAHFDAK
jgi:coenzyme F420-reducing hydrogenase delta subunit